MISNSLTAPVRSLLISNAGRYTEYALIRALVESGDLPVDYAATSLDLFRTHFKLMNALYHLQLEWAVEGRYLHVSPLEIYLGARANREAITSLPETSVVREFYLDWRQFEAATEDTVASLLKNFWRKYAAQGVDEREREEALSVLGLVEPVDFSTVKQRYRRLAMTHHPDRGGDDNSLQEINNAMEVLTQIFSQK